MARLELTLDVLESLTGQLSCAFQRALIVGDSRANVFETPEVSRLIFGAGAPLCEASGENVEFLD